MNKFWSKQVSALMPYTAGEQPKGSDIIKLNTNENPFGPSPAVLNGLLSLLNDSLRLYPDPDSVALCSSIAEYFSLAPDQVFVGNGSDEVLAHVFNALLKHDKPVLFPDVTYSFYKTYACLYQVQYLTVPLCEDFSINPVDYLQNNGGIIFANPNAPTGMVLDADSIRYILEVNPESVVVVDEAYVDFGGISSVSLINEYPNLLVIQTFSKSRSLAGLRIGFALGQKHLIEALNRVKNSFNSYPLDRMAQRAAQLSLQDVNWFSSTCHKVIVERNRLGILLTNHGFRVLPSAANFLFVSHSFLSAESIALRLREHHIYVRHFSGGRINNWLRITVGLASQNDELIRILGHIISK